jgi:3-oxoacyl-[acyl-carrier protein] reductase
MSRFVAHAGRLDVLFNNAGSPVRRTRVEDCPAELWQEVFAVNVHSAFYVTRQAIPALRASGHGSVINNLTLSVQTGGARSTKAAGSGLLSASCSPRTDPRGFLLYNPAEECRYSP